jgi:hypothetical protein
LDKFENGGLEKLVGKRTINIGLSKTSNYVWFGVFLLGIVLFSFIYYNNPNSIVLVSIMGGICVLGAFVTGYSIFDRNPKLTVTPEILSYNYTFQSEIKVTDILATYLYRDYDSVNEDARLIIYKIDKVDPEEWLLYGLEYSPNDIGRLVEKTKKK